METVGAFILEFFSSGFRWIPFSRTLDAHLHCSFGNLPGELSCVHIDDLVSVMFDGHFYNHPLGFFSVLLGSTFSFLGFSVYCVPVLFISSKSLMSPPVNDLMKGWFPFQNYNNKFPYFYWNSRFVVPYILYFCYRCSWSSQFNEADCL